MLPDKFCLGEIWISELEMQFITVNSGNYMFTWILAGFVNHQLKMALCTQVIAVYVTIYKSQKRREKKSVSNL